MEHGNPAAQLQLKRFGKRLGKRLGTSARREKASASEQTITRRVIRAPGKSERLANQNAYLVSVDPLKYTVRVPGAVVLNS